MPNQAVQNNMEIAQQIKARRNELNLTIEDAVTVGSLILDALTDAAEWSQ